MEAADVAIRRAVREPQERIAECSRSKIVQKQGKLKQKRITYEIGDHTLCWKLKQSAEDPNAPQGPLGAMCRSSM